MCGVLKKGKRRKEKGRKRNRFLPFAFHLFPSPHQQCKEKTSVTFLKAKLQVGLDSPEVMDLMGYLTRDGRLRIQFVDSDKRLRAESGTCPGGCHGLCPDVQGRLVEQALASGNPQCGVCPRGGKVTIFPIMRLSAVFGALCICESQPLITVASAEPAESATFVDPLVNTLKSFVARNSFYEMEVESLTNDLALRYEELALLYEIGERIPIRAQVSTLIDYVVERLKEVIICDCVCWVPRDGGENRLYWSNPDRKNKELSEALEKVARQIDCRVREKSDMVSVNDLPADDVLREFAGKLVAVSGYPVATDGEHYGSLVLFRLESGQFHSGEAMLVLAVMRRSGVVIRNARLYQELNELFLNTIKTLVRLIEGKDEYTRGHSERVSMFSLMLAEILGLPVEEREALRLSSLLHDIGKIKVPEEVLKKPGSLTEEEFAVIKQHPGFGAEMLSPISQFGHCLPDIRHHHERIDGKGYPDGLKADEIPLRARIIAVADTFDALTSDRCYRPRFGPDQAFKIVQQAAGTQLYSEAAAALVDSKDRFAECLQTEFRNQSSEFRMEGASHAEELKSES